MSDALGPTKLDIRPKKPPIWSRISVVWLVPVLALAVSLGIAWKSYSERGELIQIAFSNALGIEAGQTVLKYRDVTVGQVEDLSFTPDLSRVVVSVRADREILPFLDRSAQFWVVRPEITTQGISGLNTVLSGVHIEGTWDRDPEGEATRTFLGLDAAPTVTANEDGTWVTLRASDGGRLTAGAPVLFRGIEVGRLQNPRLSRTGDAVLIDAFIYAPEDRRLTSATRFWDRSGFDISLDTTGVRLNVGTLASLVQGGVSFDTVFSGGDPLDENTVFDIFEDEQAARNSLFNAAEAAEVPLSVVFNTSVNGLSVGSVVRFKGINVGRVTNISAYVDEDGVRPEVRLLANFTVQPSKLGLHEDATEEETIDFLQASVAGGLRVRLATQSLISGALMLELVEVPDAAEDAIDRDAQPYPRMPSVAAELTDFTATAEGVFERINALPVEELMQAAIEVLENTNAVVSNQSARELPDELLALLGDARGLVNSEDLRAAPVELRAAMADLNELISSIKEGGAAANLLAALDDAAAAAANVSAASEGMPALVEQLNALSAKANALPVEELVTATTALVERADAIIGTEEAAAIPGEMRAALADVNAMLAQLRGGGAAANLVTALEEASAASVSINSASEGLPALVEDLEALAAKANDLPLSDLVTSATSLVETADGLIGTEDAAGVPAALNGALAEVRTVLVEIREGGAVANANATFASIQSAAQAVEEAAASLPALAERLNGLVARAEATLGGYGADSRFNEQTLATLREVREAAEALSSLARAIERRPDSLIRGR